LSVESRLTGAIKNASMGWREEKSLVSLQVIDDFSVVVVDGSSGRFC
jgi:hypothetical protein